MKSKTIILSSENQTGRGILTLYQEESLLQCRIRLYNTPKLNRFCKIGIYHEKQVYSANLLEKNGVYTSSMVGNFNIDQDFYSAIINTNNNNEVILSGGTYAGFFFNDQSVFNNTELENKFEKIEKENPNTNLYNYNGNTSQSFDSKTNHFTLDNNVDNKNLHNIINENQYRDDNSHNDSNTKTNEPNTCHDYNNNQDIKEQSLKNEAGDNQTIKESEKQQCDEACEKCKSCVYKEFFYSQKDNLSQNNSTLNNSSTTLETTENLSSSKQHLNYNYNDNCDNNINNEHFKVNYRDYNNNQDNNTIQSGNNSNENEIENNQINETTNKNEQNDNLSVLSAIIPQFKYVFENYPQDETLNNLIPNSKFVKINENNEQYSIGAIYEEDEMKYICYAVLCNYNSPAPLELGEHYQWLPLDKEDPLSEGYYMVFQDAKDLKIVEL